MLILKLGLSKAFLAPHAPAWSGSPYLLLIFGLGHNAVAIPQGILARRLLDGTLPLRNLSARLDGLDRLRLGLGTFLPGLGTNGNLLLFLDLFLILANGLFLSGLGLHIGTAPGLFLRQSPGFGLRLTTHLLLCTAAVLFLPSLALLIFLIRKPTGLDLGTTSL